MARLQPRALGTAIAGLAIVAALGTAGGPLVKANRVLAATRPGAVANASIVTPPGSDLRRVDPPMPDPPELGDILLDDPLTGPPLVEGSTCPTGRSAREFVGEGFIIKVAGRCMPTDTFAGAIREVSRLAFADGALRLEMRTVSGPERAQLRLMFRDQGKDTHSYYTVRLTPQTGTLALLKGAGPAGGPDITLATGDVQGLVSPTDWNTLEIRARGDQIWVLVNDQPTVAVTDPGWAEGRVLFGVDRLGDVEDPAESAVVFRNLRVTQLAAEYGARPSVYPSTAARRPGATRVLPAELTDLKACWNLGVADAQADRAAGVWDPRWPSAPQTQEGRNCALAYVKGYLGCQLYGPCPLPAGGRVREAIAEPLAIPVDPSTPLAKPTDSFEWADWGE